MVTTKKGHLVIYKKIKRKEWKHTTIESHKITKEECKRSIKVKKELQNNNKEDTLEVMDVYGIHYSDIFTDVYLSPDLSSCIQ